MRGRGLLAVFVLLGGLPGPVARAESPSAASFPATLGRSVTASFSARDTVDFTFVPTHVAFSWSGPERSRVRYRLPGGSWERVTEAHDLADGDRHYSGVLSVARPSQLEWAASRGATGVALEYINTLDGPSRLPSARSSAQTPAGSPRIVTRAEWGADESLRDETCDMDFYPVQQLFVHHTAGSNFDNHPKATMRAILWFHAKSRGWCDVGYNFVIGWNGTIFEGRRARSYASWEPHTSETRGGRAVSGAHVAGFNSGSVGISTMGNFDGVAPPPALRRSLAELLAWEVDRHGLQARGKHEYVNPETKKRKQLPYIAGHRDAGDTSCPGTILYSQLGAVRRDVKALIGEGKDNSSITLVASSERTDYGGSVTLSGVLTDESGTALAAREVALYLKSGTEEWTMSEPMTTASDGSFSTIVQPEASLSAAAVFSGDDALWGSQTEDVRVKVAPVLELEADDATAEVAGVSHYPSQTTTVTFSGRVNPAHPTGTVKVVFSIIDAQGTSQKLATKQPKIDSGGRFTANFTVPADGGYSARAVSEKHDDHVRAESAEVFLIVG